MSSASLSLTPTSNTKPTQLFFEYEYAKKSNDRLVRPGETSGVSYRVTPNYTIQSRAGAVKTVAVSVDRETSQGYVEVKLPTSTTGTLLHSDISNQIAYANNILSLMPDVICLWTPVELNAKTMMSRSTAVVATGAPDTYDLKCEAPEATDLTVKEWTLTITTRGQAGNQGFKYGDAAQDARRWYVLGEMSDDAAGTQTAAAVADVIATPASFSSALALRFNQAENTMSMLQFDWETTVDMEQVFNPGGGDVAALEEMVIEFSYTDMGAALGQTVVSQAASSNFDQIDCPSRLELTNNICYLQRGTADIPTSLHVRNYDKVTTATTTSFLFAGFVNPAANVMINANMYIRKWVASADNNQGDWYYTQYHVFNYIYMTQTTGSATTSTLCKAQHTTELIKETGTITLPVHTTADITIDSAEGNLRRDRLVFKRTYSGTAPETLLTNIAEVSGPLGDVYVFPIFDMWILEPTSTLDSDNCIDNYSDQSNFPCNADANCLDIQFSNIVNTYSLNSGGGDYQQVEMIGWIEYLLTDQRDYPDWSYTIDSSVSLSIEKRDSNQNCLLGRACKLSIEIGPAKTIPAGGSIRVNLPSATFASFDAICTIEHGLINGDCA